MTQWHIDQDGTDHGPFTSSQIRQLAAQQRITPETPIRRETDTEWFPASRVKNLFSAQQHVSSPADERPEPSESFATFSDAGTSDDHTTENCVAEHLYSEPELSSTVAPFAAISTPFNEQSNRLTIHVPLETPQPASAPPPAVHQETRRSSIIWQSTAAVLLSLTLLTLVVIAHEQWAYQRFEQQVHESALLRQKFSKALNDQIGGGFSRPLNELIAEERAEKNKYSWLNR